MPTQLEALQPDYQKLLQAFELFNSTSASLADAYQGLQKEVRRLSLELEAANAELKRSLEEKDNLKNYLRSILESLSNGVLVVNSASQVTVCNPAAIGMLDLPENAGEKGGSLDELPLPQALKEIIQASLRGDQSTAEDIQLQVKSKARDLRFLVISSSPVIDPTGQCTSLTVVLKDITRLKELELQNQRAERLQAMGEMAVQLAHEIRNPLGSIEIFASLLKEELHERPEIQNWTDQISTGIKFLNTIVANMLSFARSASPQFQEFDLIEVIRSTLSFIEPVFVQRHIQVTGPATSEALTITGDPGMLRQMMMNLFMNALQAMPEAGRLWVRVRTTTDQRVEIQVEDTGIGVTPDNLSRIFDPFYTTSENGTGLGLSLVHQIVEKHHGKVTAQSEFGRGTCFTINLPPGGTSEC